MFIPVSNAISLEDIMTQGDAFLETGQNNGGEDLLNTKELKNATNDIYNILLTLGIVISVVVGAILGIKYITGSVEEQAKIKETMIPYVLGCFVIFGAFGIWRTTINSLQNIIIPSEDQAYISEKGKWVWCRECNRELTAYEIDDNRNAYSEHECCIDKEHNTFTRTSRLLCAVCGYPGTTASCKWCPKGYAIVKGFWPRCAECKVEINSVAEANLHPTDNGEHAIFVTYERYYCLTCHKETKTTTRCSECGKSF